MFLQISKDAEDRLRSLLLEDDMPCVRIRNYTLGCGWNTSIILGVSLDEMNEDDDIKVEVNGITYIAEEAILGTHGKFFSIFINDKGAISIAKVQ